MICTKIRPYPHTCRMIYVLLCLREGYEYCDQRVSLSVRSHISKITRPNFIKFSVAVARSSSDDNAIYNILLGFVDNATFSNNEANGEESIRGHYIWSSSPGSRTSRRLLQAHWRLSVLSRLSCLPEQSTYRLPKHSDGCWAVFCLESWGHPAKVHKI